MSSSVDKIKERLAIADVISSYLSLVQAGKNYKAKCPFHNEKTPSFFISPERDSYYCFGCGAKGDIFTFVQHFEGTDFLGALKLLADKAGVVLENKFSKEPKEDKEKLYEIMEEATLFFETMFSKESAPREYLKDRGITNKTIESFRIGYAPSLWQSVSTHLIERGFKKEDIEKVGLVKIKEDSSFYDRFRSRIIFPISDSSGRVIAFSGRIFHISDKDTSIHAENKDFEEAKYLNSPETPLFNKSNTLFGIDKAKISIRKRDYSIIVEGQMDLILSHQAGFTNTVAVSGTALSDRVNEKTSYSSEAKGNSSGVSSLKVNNLGLIRRLSSNVIFAFDGDSAGLRAMNRSSIIALSLDMQVKVAVIPEEKDPADIILENIDNWKEIIKKSINIINFHLDRICQNTDDIRLRGKQIRDIIFPFLLVIKSSIEKSAYVSLIYKKTGLPEDSIIKDFQEYEKNQDLNKNKSNEEEDLKKTKSRRDRLEERLLGIYSWQDGIDPPNLDKSEKVLGVPESPELVRSLEVFKEIKELYNSFEKRMKEGYFEKIKEKHKSNLSVLAFEAEIWYGDKTDRIIPATKEIIFNLEEEILNEDLFLLKNKINQEENKPTRPHDSSGASEEDKREEEISLLLKEYQKINERIENIKNYRIQ